MRKFCFGLRQRGDSAVQDERRGREVGTQAIHKTVVKRWHFAVLFWTQPFQPCIACVRDENPAPCSFKRADEVAHETIVFGLVEANAVFDRDWNSYGVAHRFDAVGDQLWFGHQAGTKGSAHDTLRWAAAVEVDFGITPGFAKLRTAREVGAVTAAKLQC